MSDIRETVISMINKVMDLMSSPAQVLYILY